MAHVDTISNDDHEESPQVGSGLHAITKRSLEYTSENYKLEISNLPPRQDYHLIRHLLEKNYKLQPHKIRVGHEKAFVAFTTEAARDDAITIIDGREWKGYKLEAKPAAPRNDPMAKKIKPDDQDDDLEGMQVKDINSQVCPLWEKPYEEQLKIKENLMRQILNFNRTISKFSRHLASECPSLNDWLEKNTKICCTFDGIQPSPVLRGYRNKCELNVGSDGTVGFRLGRYKNGSERVVSPPRDCPILNDLMFQVTDAFQGYMNNSTKLKGFSHVSHEGNVRQLTIRTNQQNECLVIVDLHPQDMTDTDLSGETAAIIKCLTDIDSVKSIYLNISSKHHLSGLDQTVRLIFGQEHLYELMQLTSDTTLRFRIGPASFFQVNTKAAELLYRSIIDLSNLNAKSVVLDVGCGTGTISLSVARYVSYVIGIEIVESAVEDAKKNAQDNSITNVQFFAGRAEDLISESITILRSRVSNDEGSEIVAIVDPPRNGFNNSFIKHIRASSIRKIIYIACDPKANSNLTALCRPTSKAYRGDPFVPTRAKAFDLFPHTKFCELVLVYERLRTSSGISTNVAIQE